MRTSIVIGVVLLPVCSRKVFTVAGEKHTEKALEESPAADKSVGTGEVQQWRGDSELCAWSFIAARREAVRRRRGTIVVGMEGGPEGEKEQSYGNVRLTGVGRRAGVALRQVGGMVTLVQSYVNPFSTMTPFHVHSGYYLGILYSFRNLCRDYNSENSDH
ncbi:hypothetical protein E2C01_015093 [Portunus trituberculatus]|uniref:Uncharacterized protein n=1 Tax=Portunus trituberculatus TaxID=210409 RepID=A0A5B7DLS9_PORTR|nr:hypothetical protein [Portunus trituberculatus]